MPGKAIVFDDSFWHEAENRAKPIGTARRDIDRSNLFEGSSAWDMSDGRRGQLGSDEHSENSSERRSSTDSQREAGGEDGEGPRVVLIFDVWHPDLSDEEVWLGWDGMGWCFCC